jgi:hypothetical protein
VAVPRLHRGLAGLTDGPRTSTLSGPTDHPTPFDRNRPPWAPAFLFPPTAGVPPRRRSLAQGCLRGHYDLPPTARIRPLVSLERRHVASGQSTLQCDVVRLPRGGDHEATMSIGLPTGIGRSCNKLASWSRMQPCETGAPLVPMALSDPRGPWMATIASPELSQSVIVLEWADVTITKAPYPGLGGAARKATKYCPGGVGYWGVPIPTGTLRMS